MRHPRCNTPRPLLLTVYHKSLTCCCCLPPGVGGDSVPRSERRSDMKAPGSPKRDSGPARPSWENLQAASSFVPPEPGTMGAADGGLVGGAGGYIGGKGGGKGFDRPFDNRPCYDFQKGMCNRTHCRFLHEIVNAGVAGFNPDFCPTEFAMAQPPRSLMPGFPVQRMQPQPEQAPQAQAAGLQFALPDHFKAPAGMTKQQMHEKSMNEMREREKNPSTPATPPS